MRKNSAKAWILAARPKTLTGAAMPVIVALAMAWYDLGSTEFQWLPALLCLLFAFLMQIDANFINDYYDCARGIDGEDRLGPERACQQGWITMPAMKQGIWITTAASCLSGLPLVLWGETGMVLVGIACVVFCFLYTTLLARLGLGDVLVLVFFGLVPVGATYYIQAQNLPLNVILMGVAVGLVTDCLLLVNNYRDRETDARHGKHTLVTMIGAKATECLYLACGIVAIMIASLVAWRMDLPGMRGMILYMVLHAASLREMHRINHGKKLNAVLGRTALNIFLYGLIFALTLLWYKA